MCLFSFVLFALVSSFPTTLQKHARGFDTTEVCNASCMRCMTLYRNRFFIGRVYADEGGFDEVGIRNIEDAIEAGIAVHGRIQPCLEPAKCPSSESQARSISSRVLELLGRRLSGIFLDVATPDSWSQNKTVNEEFVNRFLDSLSANLPSLNYTGVYTNYSSWIQVVGRRWKPPSANNTISLWLANFHHSPTPMPFKPFGGWSKPDFYQVGFRIHGPCGVEINSDSMSPPEPIPSKTGIPWIIVASAVGMMLALVCVAVFFALRVRRRGRRMGYAQLIDGAEFTSISTLVEEIFGMAAANVGGTLIIPALQSAAETLFYSDIGRRQNIIGKPLTKGSLLRLFSTRRDGHDGAVIVDIFGKPVPWIRSSQHHLPYDAARHTGTVANRGLRHNSAAYASTLTSSMIIVVSEERGDVNVFLDGLHYAGLSAEELSAKFRSFVCDIAALVTGSL